MFYCYCPLFLNHPFPSFLGEGSSTVITLQNYEMTLLLLWFPNIIYLVLIALLLRCYSIHQTKDGKFLVIHSRAVTLLQWKGWWWYRQILPELHKKIWTAIQLFLDGWLSSAIAVTRIQRSQCMCVWWWWWESFDRITRNT